MVNSWWLLVFALVFFVAGYVTAIYSTTFERTEQS